MRQLGEHSGTAVIVGAGPSVAGNVEVIRALASQPRSVVFPINCMHDWLLDRGVTPGIQVMFEADADPAVVVGRPCADATYYICSACPPAYHDYLRGHRRVLWHYWEHHREYQDVLSTCYPGEDMVGGGYPTLFRAINIALALGFRRLELLGVDSSFEQDDQQNLAGYPTHPSMDNLADVWFPCLETGSERRFRTSGALAFQAEMMREWLTENRGRVSVDVHGDGLLPHMYRQDKLKEVRHGAQH